MADRFYPPCVVGGGEVVGVHPVGARERAAGFEDAVDFPVGGVLVRAMAEGVEGVGPVKVMFRKGKFGEVGVGECDLGGEVRFIGEAGGDANLFVDNVDGGDVEVGDGGCDRAGRPADAAAEVEDALAGAEMAANLLLLGCARLGESLAGREGGKVEGGPQLLM